MKVAYERLKNPVGACACAKKGCDERAEFFVICKYFALAFCDKHKKLEWLDLKGVNS